MLTSILGTAVYAHAPQTIERMRSLFASKNEDGFPHQLSYRLYIILLCLFILSVLSVKILTNNTYVRTTSSVM